MVNCGSLLKSALVILALVAVVQPGSAPEKLASCCKTVSNQKITEPILGYLVQTATPSCVRAVIFQTEAGLFCSQVTAPWVRRKIVAFERAKALAIPSSVVPSSTVSLLSIITSTASPSSSSI
uniref:CC chemokine 1 n=1 Tax=Oplegnathus fasciatus TaxID=163134 RepID=I7H6Y8_OPLFA|nr:CC chemokine 1 [Oplegnathus fasciatus]